MRRLLPLLAVLTALIAAVPAAAEAKRGPCVVGGSKPRCEVSYGRVPYQANDGDTLDVRVDGTSGYTRVRIAGIQAMELTDYGTVRAGECHAVDAAQRLDELLDLAGRRVRLAALDPEDASRQRALRSVAIKVGGRWLDVGAQLIAEGQALWLPYSSEWVWNAAYSRLSRLSAELAQQGLWRQDACGPGPNEGAQLQLWVSSNPAGSDLDHLNEEYVTVRNADPVQTVDLSGWRVRDSALDFHTFAPGTVLAPGAWVTVHVGEGIDTATDRFMGKREGVFANATSDERALGDGGYLFDPQGDLRASMVYPCRLDCTDRYEGAVRLRAHPSGTEHVDVRNTSGATVDLFGYRLYASPYQYAFPPGTVLEAGAVLRVTIKGDPAQDTATRKAWGLDRNVLNNGGDRVKVQTFDDIDLACDSWGTSSCG